nr:hypothetical protein [Tanacetum cinerariifolium]
LVSIASRGVGDTCLSGISVSKYESSEHRKGETIGATDTRGSELFDGSTFDDERVSSSSTPEGEATAAAPTSGAIRTSTEIEPIRITHRKEDPTLLTDTSEEIEITGAAIICISKSLYKSPLYQAMPMRVMQKKIKMV